MTMLKAILQLHIHQLSMNRTKKKHAKKKEEKRKKNSRQQVSIGNESQCDNGATIYNSLKQAI